MTAPGAYSDATARVMLAVLAGARTYPALMAATGLAKSTLHQQLVTLRRLGLVTWVDGQHGTLRPTSTTNPCSATLGGDNLSGPGAVGAAPGRGRHHLGGVDMAGHYPDAAASNEAT